MRDYPSMNVRTDYYYGQLWDGAIAAASATNQVWTIACNAVGRHGVSGVSFWGGSGVWAPSGSNLIQASRANEELLIVHNLDIKGTRDAERGEFNYAIDFHDIYRPLEDSRGFTRTMGESPHPCAFLGTPPRRLNARPGHPLAPPGRVSSLAA